MTRSALETYKPEVKNWWLKNLPQAFSSFSHENLEVALSEGKISKFSTVVARGATVNKQAMRKLFRDPLQVHLLKLISRGAAGCAIEANKNQMALVETFHPTRQQIPFLIVCGVWDSLNDAKDRFRLATLFRIERLQAIALESVPVASLDKCSATGKIELMSFRLKHKDIKHNVPRTWSLKQEALEYTQIIYRSGNLEWTDNSLRWATRYARSDVLNWWLHSGLEMAIPYDVIEAGAKSNSLDVLRWWKEQDDKGRLETFKLSKRTSVCGTNPIRECVYGLHEMNCHALYQSSLDGNVKILNWMLRELRRGGTGNCTIHWDQVVKNRCPDCNEKAMVMATMNGQVDVLDWWKNSRLTLRWNKDSVMDCASEHGHVKVLQWWKDSGLEFTWSSASMDKASEKGHVDVLEWWKQSGLQPRYSKSALIEAFKKQNVHVLEWWNNSGLPLLVDSTLSMDYMSLLNQIENLEWWKKFGPQITWSERAMDLASSRGNMSVLEWWKCSGLELKWTAYAMDQASANGHVEVLQWWKQCGLECKYSIQAFGGACRKGHVKVLDWWKGSGLKLLYLPMTRHILDQVKPEVNKWWLDNGLPVL